MTTPIDLENHKTATSWAVGGLLLNALIWGTSWWHLRLLNEAGIHPLWVTTTFSLLATVLTLVIYPMKLHEFVQHRQLFLLAAAAGMTNICFNWAVTIEDVVRVVLLFYLMPAWAVLLAWGVLKEKPHPAAWLQVLLSLVGVFFVLEKPGAELPLPQSLGDWLGLLGGFCFALNNILLRKLRGVSAGNRMLAMFFGGVVISMAGLAILTQKGVSVSLPMMQWQWGAVVLGFSLLVILGNSSLQYAAARLSARSTALIMLSEILFSTLSCFFAGLVNLSFTNIIGGMLIVMAAVWSIWH